MQALLLDLGNVLVFHDNALLFRRLGERAGLDGAEVERRLTGRGWEASNLGQMSAEEIWRWVCSALGLQLAAGDFNALWCCHFTVNHAVMPAVEALAGRVPLVLLSNANPIHVEHVRPLVPVLARFDQVLFSCEVGLAKPDPRFYREALRRARAAPEQTAYFDDHAPFLEPARAMGIQARLFTTVDQFRRDLEALGLAVP